MTDDTDVQGVGYSKMLCSLYIGAEQGGMKMEYVLTTENLTKQYRNFKALSGLSMHVEKGAIYGFVGRNGAGKNDVDPLICGLQTLRREVILCMGKRTLKGIWKR